MNSSPSVSIPASESSSFSSSSLSSSDSFSSFSTSATGSSTVANVSTAGSSVTGASSDSSSTGSSLGIGSSSVSGSSNRRSMASASSSMAFKRKPRFSTRRFPSNRCSATEPKVGVAAVCTASCAFSANRLVINRCAAAWRTTFPVAEQTSCTASSFPSVFSCTERTASFSFFNVFSENPIIHTHPLRYSI